MIFVCFVVFTFLFVAFFGGGKLSLDFHDLFYNLNFEKEKLLLKDLFEGCLILNYYYNRGIQMYRFPNSDVQKSVIFEGIKKRLKIV